MIAGLEVVEARLYVVVVPTIPQRVHVGEASGAGKELAPGVVGVFGVDRAALEIELYYVALCIGYIVEGVIACDAGISILPHSEGLAILVVEEIQTPDEGSCGGVCDSLTDNLAVLRHVFMPQTVRDLYRANAGHIVFVGIRIAASGDAFQSAALLPVQVRVAVPVVPVDRIAAGDCSRHGAGQGVAGLALVSNGVSVVSRQQVRPGEIAVAVGNDVTAAADRAEITRRVYCIIDEGTLGTLLRLSYNSHYSIREPSPD